jgi:YesN/AraC family two-component response regulator
VYTITFLAISRRYLQNINTVKYQTINVTDEEVDDVFRSVETLMQQGRLYLEPDISLANLSKQLKISAQKLSFVINTRAGSNFNEYINKFRVKNAIEILKNPGSKDLTIASIGYDSGFNSLSSFNVAFKKFTGVTPSEYRKVRI